MPMMQRAALVFAIFVGVCAALEKDAAEAKQIQELQNRLAHLEQLLEEHSRRDDHVTARHLSVADLTVCLDYMWLLVCGALVMFMQAGFALLEAGAVRAKNCGMVLLKNLVDVLLGTVMWYFIGYGIAYGVDTSTEEPNKVIGVENFAGSKFLEVDGDDAIIGTNHFKDWFFQWAFCATAATIVSGGVAERIQFPAYMFYSAVMTGIIYPFVVYWTWSGSGWLTIGGGDLAEPNGYSDFAGSGIVHLTGGVGALVGAVVLGPRTNRWERPEEFQPHNITSVVLGTFILWFGWYGFNCGSTLAFSDAGTATQAGLVAMNTTLSASTGGLTIFFLRLRHKSFDVCGLCNGILAGLVAICAGVGDFTPFASFITGILGGLACEGGSTLMKFLQVDDPLDAFSVHGCSGMVGLIVRPIFDRTGAKGDMFVWNLIGLVVIFLWSGGLSALVLVPLKLAGHLRAPAEEEEHGGDMMLANYETPVKVPTRVVPS